MDYNKLFQSKGFKGAILGVAIFIIMLFVFKVGMFLGFKKANFSYKWGENYQQNFAGPRSGFFTGIAREFSGRDFVESHGIIGQIIKIDGQNLIIKGTDNTEKVVVAKDDTAIMRFRDSIKAGDLKVDDYVVIVGQPDDSGQIEAKLIRVMPAPFPKNKR